MKKSILASSIAAAVFGLGAITGAQAAIEAGPNGTGEILLVPYYSAQGGNATLLSITNTDTVNGKAVKVRFRGAANSDDVLDFQVFLSPADVWTAMVSKGEDGRAVLTTSDASCTKPNKLSGTSFLTVRLDPTLTGDALANGTREGYVEIIGMADIPKNATTGSGTGVTGLKATSATDPTNPLFTAVKHINKVAPCTGTAWTALDELPQVTPLADFVTKWGMVPSTGGLMANWTIINTVNSAAWSGQATALLSDRAPGVIATTGGSPAVTTYASAKNVIYFSQVATAVTSPDAFTADPLFLTGDKVHAGISNTAALSNTSAATTPAIATPGLYDLPDLTTPIESANTSPVVQLVQVQGKLLKEKVVAEYATESAINGSTDWVFSMPTRRYAVAMAYSKVAGTDDGRRFNAAYLLSTAGATGVYPATPSAAPTGTAASATAPFNAVNTQVINRLICVSGSKPVSYDREESTATTTVVVSPSVLGKSQYCGEVSVFAFNNGAVSAALQASVAVSAVDVNYTAGWATLGTGVTSADGTTALGLPLLGAAFTKATNGAQGFGTTQAYRH